MGSWCNHEDYKSSMNIYFFDRPYRLLSVLKFHWVHTIYAMFGAYTNCLTRQTTKTLLYRIVITTSAQTTALHNNNPIDFIVRRRMSMTHDYCIRDVSNHTT